MTRPASARRKAAGLFAAFAVVALALAPALAEARAGGRFSSGSRGSQTYSAPPATRTAPAPAQQFQRTETPQTRPGTPATAPQPATARGGLFGGSPLMAGLMGGLLGAGLFGLFAGHGFLGFAGFAGFLGLLLQLALIGGLAFLALRLIRGRRPAMAGGAQPMAREMQGGLGPRPMGAAAGAAGATMRPLEISAADYQAFERNLLAVQAAWSAQDLEALRRLSTPEMTRYFAQDIEDLKARGWSNEARDVKLEAGDLAEAWSENGQDYATVAMRFSLVDVTTDAAGRVVEGDPMVRDMATELWTFTRRPGTDWVLSAIQQTG